MNRYVKAVITKISSLFNSRICFSSTIISSKIDKSASVRQKCRIYGSSLGRYSYICRNSLIQNTEIGSFCSVSEGCNIGLPSHPIDFLSTSPVFLKGSNYLKKNLTSLEYRDCERTVIGNDVWIGTGVLIKSGVKIADGAVIGAGAVVTKDIPPYAVAAGVPAKIIKFRFDSEKAEKLLNDRWWDMTDGEIVKYMTSANLSDTAGEEQ